MIAELLDTVTENEVVLLTVLLKVNILPLLALFERIGTKPNDGYFFSIKNNPFVFNEILSSSVNPKYPSNCIPPNPSVNDG